MIELFCFLKNLSIFNCFVFSCFLILFCKEFFCVVFNLLDILVYGVFVNEKL